MKNVFKKISVVLFALVLVVVAVKIDSKADNSIVTFNETYINPLYADSVEKEDLLSFQESGISVCEDIPYCTTVEEAGEVMREALEERKSEIEIEYITEDYTTALREVSTEALKHTGVPTEGDYLEWQYAGWNGTVSGSFSGGYYYITLKYAVTYYTTAEQEKVVTETIDTLLNQFDVYQADDYKKIKTIYDYICNHTTYDYNNLNENCKCKLDTCAVEISSSERRA